MSRIGSFKLKLVGWFALLALVPLAVAFYGYHSLAGQSETRRVDAGLEAGLRAAVGAYATRLDAASARARSLAEDPRVVRALARHDEHALAGIVPPLPPQPAVVQTVTVVHGGKVLGRVSVGVPLSRELLTELGSGLEAADRLSAVRSGRIVAGPGAGEALHLDPGKPVRVVVSGRSYRALGTAVLGGRPGVMLVALTPQSAIDASAGMVEQRVLGALAAALALFTVAAYLLGRSVVGTLRRLAGAADAIAGGTLHERVDVRGNDEFAQLGRAFNRMAAELEQRVRELDAERLRVREAFTRFGEALAATHDPDQLLWVVVESAVEATGAAGGVVLGPGGELARAGDPDAGAERYALPLRRGAAGPDFGLLVLTGSGFDHSQIEAAMSLTAQVVVALENARLHAIVERQALVDSLTGLANRRSLEETLRAEVARAIRFDESVCLVLADLDDFKRINDRYGHAVGDEVLKEFAAVLGDTVRESDAAGRWGGEEFALVLGATDLAGGLRLAERARAAFDERVVVLPDGSRIHATASFGVAAFPEIPERDLLLEAADAALYQAKRDGKNRVARSLESTSKGMV
ncbi:MAG TPA: diguanylate cyclase [Candidatus Limnocylindrales bacterium]